MRHIRVPFLGGADYCQWTGEHMRASCSPMASTEAKYSFRGYLSYELLHRSEFSVLRMRFNPDLRKAWEMFALTLQQLPTIDA
jgi:hypothetical protein